MRLDRAPDPPARRARLLPQTHSELAETRAELEQLADDILAIKMLMDEEASCADGSASGSFDWDSAASAPAYQGGGASDEDETLDVLQSLAALSRQLAADAAEDDELLQSLARMEESEAAPDAEE